MHTTDRKFRSIKKKLLCTIIIVSTAISTIMTCIQYSREYSNKVHSLNQKIHDLTESSKASIARSLWNLDKQQLTLQMTSMIKVDDITAIKVYSETGELYYEASKEDHVEASDISLAVALNSDRFDTNRVIGSLEIFATNSHIKDEIFESIIFFLISQFIKSIIISMLILMVIRFYLIKHLFVISDFMKNFDFTSNKNNKIHLNRNSKYMDELDDIETSINIFIDKLSEVNHEKNQLIKDQENEIHVQKAASINQARLASLGEMAASIAHEINNPLTILSFSGKKLEQLAKDEEVDSDRLLHFSKMINRTVFRMSKIIRGLKKLGRDADNDEMKEVKVSEIIDNVLDLCQVSVANKGIKINTKFTNIDLKSKINCREVQITQILVNLLNNSVDEVKSKDNPWVTIDTVFKDNKYYLSVEDCGQGIPKDIEEKIFQPFFTTKDVGEGTGLGLSISAKMAREHAGFLYIDKTVQNTRMTLELPL